jgi:hydroxymethylbilane synthase
MGGSCQTPLAAHATLDGEQLTLDALCGTPDGTTILRTRTQGTLADAAAVGVRAADDLLARGAAAIVAAATRR